MSVCLGMKEIPNFFIIVLSSMDPLVSLKENRDETGIQAIACEVPATETGEKKGKLAVFVARLLGESRTLPLVAYLHHAPAP